MERQKVREDGAQAKSVIDEEKVRVIREEVRRGPEGREEEGKKRYRVKVSKRGGEKKGDRREGERGIKMNKVLPITPKSMNIPT